MAKSHFICSDFQVQGTVHSTDVFCTLRVLFFFGCAFVCLCGRLTVHSFAVNLVFGSLISKPLRQRQRIHWLCSVRYNFIHFFAVLYKIQHEKATFCVENVNYGGQFLKLLFRILTLSYIFCWEYL